MLTREATIGILIGLTLGGIAGALIEFRLPMTDKSQSYGLSVNQSTGKPKFHVRGQPEIK